MGARRHGRTARRGRARALVAGTAAAALLTTLVVAAPWHPAAGTGAEPSTTTGTIAGVVTDAGSDAPVAGAYVAALDTSTFRLRGGTTTAPDGTYSLPVPEGTYLVQSLDPAGLHQARWHPGTGDVGEATTVEVAAATPTSVDLALPPSGRSAAVAGTVTTAGSSDGVAGAWVLVQDEHLTIVGGGVADDAGEYLVTGLPAGTHRLAVVDPTGAHRVTYFEQASLIFDADPVVLSAGVTTAADVAVPASEPTATGGASLTGTVTDDGSAAPVADAFVLALDAATMAFEGGAATDGSGAYVLDVPDGSYAVLAIDPTGAHSPRWAGDSARPPGEVVTVASDDPGVVDLSLPPDGPTAAVAGTITEHTGGAPAAGVWAVALSSDGAVAGAATTGEDGAYRIDGLVAGEARLLVADPSGRLDPEWFDDAAGPNESTPIDLAAGTAALADVALAGPASPAVDVVAMGSAGAALGNDPFSAAQQPNFWLTVAGPQATKISGDRYTSGYCSNGAGGLVTGCEATGPNLNLEFDEHGHSFVVQVDDPPPGAPLRIQVYDPAYTYQGDTCGNNNLTTAQRTALRDLPESSLDDAEVRFASPANGYCAGDQSLNGHNTATTYVVRAPDDTPADVTDNPVVSACVRTFSGRNSSGTEIYDRLRETAAYDEPAEQGYEQVPFRAHFRQWFTLCTVPAAEVEQGRYVVQVRADPDLSDLPMSAVDADLASTSAGHNRFALRAGFGTGTTPAGTGVHLFGPGRLPVYVNGPPSATTGLRLARLTPDHAGGTATFELFDVADVIASVDLAVLPPVDSNVGSSFAACSAVRDGPPFTVPVQSPCSITGMTQADYNGRTVRVTVPIPEDYTCAAWSAEGCWVRIAMSYAPSAQPHDTTTWTAHLGG